MELRNHTDNQLNAEVAKLTASSQFEFLKEVALRRITTLHHGLETARDPFDIAKAQGAITAYRWLLRDCDSRISV